MTERWSFRPEADTDDAPSVDLRARVARIEAAGSDETAVAEAAALLLDPDADPAERRAVLMRQDLPLEYVLRATQAEDPGVRAFAIGMAQTPVDVIVRAASDFAWQVRVEIARHPQCPDETRAALAHDADAVVRRSALSHPAIPVDVLIDVLTIGDSRLDAEIAARHAGLDVRAHVKALMAANRFGAQALLMRSDLPAALARRFAKPDQAEPVRRAAVRSGKCSGPSIGRVLTSDPSEAVRAAAAEQPNCPPEALARAARDPRSMVRRAVAAHVDCPAEAADLLLTDVDESVRVRAAERALTSPAALGHAVLHDVDDRVRLKALANEACPAHIVDRACADPVLVLTAASQKACTPEGLFTALMTMRDMPRKPPPGTAHDSGVARQCARVHTVAAAARKRLAPRAWAWLSAHALERLHPDDLRPLLTRHLPEAATDPRVAVRIGVVNHPDVNDVSLAILAADEDEDVRRAVSARILGAVL